jgi:bifunctional non-homologous end joining protein LigD
MNEPTVNSRIKDREIVTHVEEIKLPKPTFVLDGRHGTHHDPNRRFVSTLQLNPNERHRSMRWPQHRGLTSELRMRAVPVPVIPDVQDALLDVGGRRVQLTNLKKPFWPKDGITKGDLLQYYADVSPYLLPHLRDRAMVMKRYPNGADGGCFFMKRVPEPHPNWLDTCSIVHQSGNVIDFPMIQDLASLLWVVNLGCIDLNPWYARCDDVHRPDFLHFDLDPGPGASFAKVLDAALIVREALESLGMPTFVKTTGSSGVHLSVPIARGPLQKEVWTFAKALSKALAAQHPKLLTAEYRIADRPRGRVLVDYNQNAWGRTLASIYSVRPKPRATVSTPLAWSEVEAGVVLTKFRMENVPARLKRLGDLWKPLLAPRKRVRLERFL